MEIKYQLTEKSFLQLQGFAFRKLSKSGKRAVAMSLLSSVCMFIFFLLAIYIKSAKDVPFFSMENWLFWLNNPDQAFLPALLLLVAIISLRNAAIYPQSHLRKWLRNPLNQAILLPQVLTLNSDGIEIATSQDNGSQIPWTALGNIVQTEDGFFIEAQPDRYFAIPKSQLSAEEISYLDKTFKKNKKEQYRLI